MVTPLLAQLRNKIHSPTITKIETIPEILAPLRKLSTNVLLLAAITNPMIGQMQSEYMKRVKPTNPGEELSKIPVMAKANTITGSEAGPNRPYRKPVVGSMT